MNPNSGDGEERHPAGGRAAPEAKRQPPGNEAGPAGGRRRVRGLVVGAAVLAAVATGLWVGSRSGSDESVVDEDERSARQEQETAASEPSHVTGLTDDRPARRDPDIHYTETADASGRDLGGTQRSDPNDAAPAVSPSETGEVSRDSGDEASAVDRAGRDGTRQRDIAVDRSTLAGIFEEAAAGRAHAVASLSEKIETGVYGVGDDGVLRGPAGFRVDINACPDHWSNIAGVTDSQIRIGHVTPQSSRLGGPLLVHGWKAYFDWINRNVPIEIDGVQHELTLISEDDGYDADLTMAIVDEFIESRDVFSIFTSGTLNTLATYDRINAECIPHPFAWTGSPAVGDPVHHPWTTGMRMSYPTESILWGEWIKENLADITPVKVAALVLDDWLGSVYESSFRAWAQAHPDVVGEFLPIRHDPDTPENLVDEMEAIASFEPDVYLSQTAGHACTVAIQEAGRNGLRDAVIAKEGALFTSSLCRSPEAWLLPAEHHAQGWRIVDGGWRDATVPAFAKDPFGAFMQGTLKAAGLDPSMLQLSVGQEYVEAWAHAYPYAEALRIAAALPGGLTRTNFILAVRSLDIYHPMLFDGIRAEMNGNADAFLVEGSQFSQFDSDTQSWNAVGEVIDVNGMTPNCAWVHNRAACRR